MIIFSVLEIGYIVILLWFIVSQILVPSIKGMPLFPLFNRKRTKLAKERKVLLQEQDLQKLDQQVDQLRKEVHPQPSEEQPNE